MKCPKCGSENCEFAGADTVVNVGSDDVGYVQFCRCNDCNYFGYDYEFPGIEDMETPMPTWLELSELGYDLEDL